MGIGLCAVGGRGLLAQAPAQPAVFQVAAPQPAPPLPKPINPTNDPVLDPFVWRSIGPANMGGRVDDIAVVESNPSIIYVGFATGGIWKTTNNGTTWTPIFDEYPVSSIGDIAIAPSNPDVIYVGTGEPNNRQSSSFGAGIFKSVNAGKTFEYVGLKETQSIGRVVVHPKDPNIVYVAALGHLFGPNAERGLFKTIDGGKTWTNTNFIDNDTGFTDVVMDPSNPNVLYAASYQRRRVPWGFNGAGPGSALWKTTDGGEEVDEAHGQRPSRQSDHRTDWDRHRAVQAGHDLCVDSKSEPSGGTGAGVNDDGTLRTARQGRGGGGGGRGDAAPEDPPPDPKKSGDVAVGRQRQDVAVTVEHGDRWMYYSQVRVDPTNPEIAYQGGAPFFKTVDGGKTWSRSRASRTATTTRSGSTRGTATTCCSATTAASTSRYDQAETWEYVEHRRRVGQFYAISADMRRPYYVCGGLQDNGSWCGPSATRSANGILNSDWYRVGGGDGFYTANDPTDWTILYSESQDGATNRVDLGAADRAASGRAGLGARSAAATRRLRQSADPEQAPAHPAQFGGRGGNPNGNIVPPPPTGTNFRFYWNTPFMLSPHNPRTRLSGRAIGCSGRSTAANTWVMSPDLTNNIGRNDRPIMGVDGKAPMASKHDGAASYSNIVTIGESPVVPGIVWVGTNDGNVQVSRDGGDTWKNVVDKVPGVPKETHVSRVEASHFDAGHRLRDVRRPSHRRSQAVRLHDEGFRRDVDVDLRRTCRPATSTSFARIPGTGTCCSSAPSTASTSR